VGKEGGWDKRHTKKTLNIHVGITTLPTHSLPPPPHTIPPTAPPLSWHQMSAPVIRPLAKLFLLSTFLEDAVRMATQWDTQVNHINTEWESQEWVGTVFVWCNLIFQVILPPPPSWSTPFLSSFIRHHLFSSSSSPTPTSTPPHSPVCTPTMCECILCPPAGGLVLVTVVLSGKEGHHSHHVTNGLPPVHSSHVKNLI
jgi:hypothetical protein